MSEADTEMKIGRREPARAWSEWGSRSSRTTRAIAEAYSYVGVSSRGTPVWLHNEVAKRDVKITIGQSQANHWGAGGGGKLILPGVVSDETIESNHCAFVTSPATHYGAVSGPMRSDIDEVASMCSLDATLNVVLDTRGRVIFVNFGAHPGVAPRGDHVLQLDLRVREPRARAGAGRHRDLRRLRADRPPLLPHRLGLHVDGHRAEGRRHDDLLLALPRRAHRGRRLPRPRADGPDEAVHAADGGELRAGAARHPRAARSRCGPAASGCPSTR